MAGQPERIPWIDLARAFAILSVIAYHAGVLPHGYIFGAFQLPLFAFLTGYATRWSQIDLTKLAHKWLKWGSAYIVAGLASIISWTAILTLYGSVPSSLQFPVGTNLGTLLTGSALPANGPLWFFLPFALSITMTAFFFSLSSPSRWLFVLAMIPFTSIPVKVFFLALILGAAWKNYEIDTELNAPHLVILGLFFTLSALINGPTDLHYGRLSNPFFFAISSLSGVLLVVHLATIFPRFVSRNIHTFFTWVGRNSLFLFVLHWPVMIGIVFLLWKMGLLADLGATPGLAGPIMPLEPSTPGMIKAFFLWGTTFLGTLGGTILISKLLLGLSQELRRRSSGVRPLQITIVGHVCVDHNVSENARYTAAGGPAIFMHMIFSQLPKNKVEIIAPYGRDFREVAPSAPLHQALPIQEKTLVYSNDSSGPKRVQKALQRTFAQPAILTPQLFESIGQSDIIFFTPLTPHYSVAYIQEIAKHKKENQLFILLPQGYFRDFGADDLVIAREGREVDNLAPLFDAIIVSNEDHPNIEKKTAIWSRSTRVITTLGDKGARFQYKNEDFVVPTNPVLPSEIVDSVGSGDIFSSAFAYEFYRTRSALKAITFANSIARQCLFFSAKDINITL